MKMVVGPFSEENRDMHKMVIYRQSAGLSMTHDQSLFLDRVCLKYHVGNR